MVVGKQTCATVVNQKQIGGLLYIFFFSTKYYGCMDGVVG